MVGAYTLTVPRIRAIDGTIVITQSWLFNSIRCMPSTHASSSYELLDGRKIYVIFALVAIVIAFANFSQ